MSTAYLLFTAPIVRSSYSRHMPSNLGYFSPVGLLSPTFHTSSQSMCMANVCCTFISFLSCFEYFLMPYCFFPLSHPPVIYSGICSYTGLGKQDYNTLKNSMLVPSDYYHSYGSKDVMCLNLCHNKLYYNYFIGFFLKTTFLNVFNTQRSRGIMKKH